MEKNPKHRGKGIATALIKKILDHFIEAQAEQITLQYIIGNTEAEHYWTKLGFKPVIIAANTTPEELKETPNTKNSR